MRVPSCALLVVLNLITLALAPAVATAQPTFGRPKSERVRSPEAPKAPSDDNADEQGEGDDRAPIVEWRESDPPQHAPSDKLDAGVYHTWVTKNGLRYAWSLPAGYGRGEAYDLVVILHPDNKDFRWGVDNHPRTADASKSFCPGAIVVCLDGPVGMHRRPTLRRFERDSATVLSVRDAMLEISRSFPTRRIIVYGFEAGGVFAVMFSSKFPALAEAVLAHGSPMPPELSFKSDVPIVLMHGAKDGSTPLRASVESVQAFRGAGNANVRLRVLRSFNDYVNPARAQEVIEFLSGMRSDDPAEMLEHAQRMLAVRNPDALNYSCPPWFAGAYALAVRARDAKDVPEDVRAKADALAKLIDAEGEAHVTKAKELVGAPDALDLYLDGGAWVGYLPALREDFRGVPSVEHFVAQIGLDTVIAKQEGVAVELCTLLETSASDKARFEAAVDALPSVAMVEWLPLDLNSRLKASMRKADELELSPESRDQFERVTLLERGWRTGLAEYQRRWLRWRFDPDAFEKSLKKADTPAE